MYIADPQNAKEDYFSVEINPINRRIDWLTELIDPNEKIININLPGTHDSASIRGSATWYSPYPRQRKKIFEQLMNGIRILDIRLKVKEQSGKIYFKTCHGHMIWNEYQPFIDVLNECKTFLSYYKTEFIMMSLKIDDMNGFDNREKEVYDALSSMINSQEFLLFRADNYASLNYQSVQGKIVILNRLTDDEKFGAYLKWENNTSSYIGVESQCEDGVCNMITMGYVQDKWKSQNVEGKLKDIKDAVSQKTDNIFVWNFISSCHYIFLPLNTNKDFLKYMGTINKNQQTKWGWFMMDFQDENYNTDKYGYLSLTEAIIDLNREKHDYNNYTVL